MLNNIIHDIFSSAQEFLASDIHFMPQQDCYQVKLRISHQLQNLCELKRSAALAIINKLKVIAQLDVTNSRLPQNGKITSGDFQGRISFCPGVAGEKVVIRCLNRNFHYALDKLGMRAQQVQHFQQHLQKPHGLILINGATGAGKSTTLYSALNYLNHGTTNIISIEDPIELTIAGIHQIELNNKIGLDFTTILPNILRQDPDVIALGEIRDAPSAKFALNAAYTGHLVIASLHSTCAQTSVKRLEYLGCSRDDIFACLQLIVTQSISSQGAHQFVLSYLQNREFYEI